MISPTIQKFELTGVYTNYYDIISVSKSGFNTIEILGLCFLATKLLLLKRQKRK